MEKVFGQVLVREIKPAMVENYQQQRSQEMTMRGKNRSTASVNREITVLRRMFNLAVREELADKNPCWQVKMVPENSVRDRILSPEELDLLLRFLPRHAAQILCFAYWTGMRPGEIFNLTWDKVDLTEKVIKLAATDTKTSEPRVIFLDGEVLEILTEVGKVRGLGHNRVFTYKGQPIASIKTCFRSACQKAGIENLRFHDLRHTFNTNMRKAGVDHSVIMKMTGHKTAAMFDRYNTVDLQDAQEAYRKLKMHLEQEKQPGAPEQGMSGANKCSHSAPREKMG